MRIFGVGSRRLSDGEVYWEQILSVSVQAHAGCCEVESELAPLGFWMHTSNQPVNVYTLNIHSFFVNHTSTKLSEQSKFSEPSFILTYCSFPLA